MKVIKCLAKLIREELEDGEKYAKMAVEYKNTDRSLADLFASLSKQELTHGDQLHDQAVRMIKEANVEAPESMKAVWEWEHEWMIDKKVRIKELLEMYKE